MPPKANSRRVQSPPSMRWAGQLEALVNRSSAMVFVWRIARDFRAEYVSEGVRQLGYTPEDFTSGRVAWPSVTHPGDVPRLRREVGEHLHSGTDEFEQNYRVFTAAGKTRWVEDRNLVLRNSRGKPTHIAGLVLDVTARRRAERALAEGERKYRCLFEQSSDAIFVHDRTGGIVDANPRACAVFGVPRDRMLKMRLSGFRDRKQPPIFRKAMRHIMAKGSFTFDRTMRRPDGRLVDMEITSSLVDREKGLVLGVMRDATERRRAERALRESEENFRAIAEHAHDAIFIEDGHRRHLYVNRRAAQLTGYSTAELLRIGSRHLLAQEERRRGMRFSRARIAGRSAPARYETSIVRKDGRRIAVEVSATRTHWRGQPATLGILRDITGRKRAEEELRRSRQMLERAQSIAKVGSITWDFATNRVKLSAEALRIHGLTPGSFRGNIGALIEQRVHPDDRNALRALLAVAPGRKGPRAVEFRVCRPDGTVASVIGNADILRDELGRMVGMVGTLQDVTERRRMEKEILDVSTRERQAIAQDLHDSLGQQLTGIAFMSRAVARGIAGGAPDAARDAEKLADLAREAVQQARRIAHGLFPVEVGGEGLAAAIRELCERTEETSGLICRCVIGSPGLVHDRTAANHLYRIAQEATQNAVKHAQARSVTVHLTTGRSGKLVIRDDGKGIGQGASGGMGLSIMRHRASLIGARLAVAARPAGGTEVVCAFANEKPSG